MFSPTQRRFRGSRELAKSTTTTTSISWTPSTDNENTDSARSLPRTSKDDFARFTTSLDLSPFPGTTDDSSENYNSSNSSSNIGTPISTEGFYKPTDNLLDFYLGNENADHNVGNHGPTSECRPLSTEYGHHSMSSSDVEVNKPLLHMSIESGHEGVVRILLREGFDINERNVHDGTTGLHVAVENRFEAILRLLLEKGANINATDNRGRTPIHLAIYAGFETGLKILLDYGAHIGSKANIY